MVLFLGLGCSDNEDRVAMGSGKSEETECAVAGGGVAMMRYAKARSSILAAMGPNTPTDGAIESEGSPEIRLCEGFRPHIPQKDDGIRIEPPPSAPSAMGTRPAATAYPEPPDEPPQ